MTLCAYGHEEIVFDSRHCPLCDIETENKRLEKKVEALGASVARLEQELDK